MTIVWKRTKLGILYPTINGKDMFWELWRKHGVVKEDMFWELWRKHGDSLDLSNAPVFDNELDAKRWATIHGYTSGFDREDRYASYHPPQTI